MSEEVRQRLKAGEQLNVGSMKIPMVDLPLGATGKLQWCFELLTVLICVAFQHAPDGPRRVHTTPPLACTPLPSNSTHPLSAARIVVSS